jgi:hypothetical protein
MLMVLKTLIYKTIPGDLHCMAFIRSQWLAPNRHFLWLTDRQSYQIREKTECIMVTNYFNERIGIKGVMWNNGENIQSNRVCVIDFVL